MYTPSNTEDLVEELFEPVISEEAYFGSKNPFSLEMLNLVNILREELKELLGANWKDSNKTSIIIKNELSTDKKSFKGLYKVLDDMGSCIARNCNVEKCYIGLFNSINAHTLPMVWDSSLLFTNLDDAVKGNRSTGYRINEKTVRTDKDLNSQLLSLEDIAIKKDGYKFKESKGKVFLINLGVPLLVDNDYETTSEEVCSIIFHEIGHNFQQILFGCNQMMLDYYTRSCLLTFVDTRFFNIFKMFDNLIMHSYLKTIINSIEKSYKYRFYVIKQLLFMNVLIKRDGTVISRDNIGEVEKENIEKIIEKARETNTLVALSNMSKFLIMFGKTIKRTIELLFIPLSNAFETAKVNDLDKRYSEVIQHNKKYEQFADVFAASYGFGSSSGKFYIRIQNLINKGKENGSISSHLSALNHIPVLSKMHAINELRVSKLRCTIYGYDQDYVRIAQQYRILDHELTTNKSLSSEDKREIIEHMEIIKQDFDTFKELEMDNYTTNADLGKYLLKTLRSGDIKKVADESGIVNGVLEVIDEYEESGIINRSKAEEKFTELNNVSSNTIVEKMAGIIKTGHDFIEKRLNIKFFN